MSAIISLTLFVGSVYGGLFATSPTPVASLSNTSLSLGYVTVGMTSVAHTVTLKNIGNATLSIAKLTITGTHAPNFAQSNNCGSSVSAGASCTINVTFTPPAAGTRTATLSITDNAPGGSQTVILTGVGIVPAIYLSPSSLTVASRLLGTNSAAQAISVRNTGSGVLLIIRLAITGTSAGDFAQTNNCGSSVAPGGNCTVSVTFTPKADGSRTASLSITDNATGSPQTVSLSGTGTGSPGTTSGTSTSPAVSLPPTSLTFASQSVGTSSAAQTVTLNNTGTAALSITSLAINGCPRRHPCGHGIDGRVLETDLQHSGRPLHRCCWLMRGT